MRKLAISYQTEKAKRLVELLAREFEAPLLAPCNVRKAGRLETVFNVIEQKCGTLDFALHSIAFAPKEDLHGRLANCLWTVY